MKKLIFSLAAASLLGVQVSAQVTIAAPQAPESPRADVRVISSATVKAVVLVNTDGISYEKHTQDQDTGDVPKRTKNFTKSFTLDNTDKINLSNQYGVITIKTWDKKEIKADITMEAYSDTEKDAQKLIDEVNIEAGKTGDVVTVKTVLSDHNGRYGKSERNGRVTWHREVRVNYTIYMPATNALTASMQYGNLNMDNFSAPTSLKVQYGNLIAGNLANSNNYISVQYGKIIVQEVNKATVKYQYGGGLNIGTAGNVDLNVQYAAATINTIKGNAVVDIQYGGGLTIGSVDNIDIDAQYTNVKLTTVNGNANVKQQYNNISIGSVQKLQVNTAYTSVTVGTLKGDGNFKMEYNKLSINDVTNACKNLTVKGEYVNIGIGFGSGYNATFDVQTDYAGFKYGSNVSSRQVNNDDDDSTKNYAGKIGNGGTAVVKIKAGYGSVSFK